MELHRNSDFVVKGNSVGIGLFPLVMYGRESWTVKKELMLLNCAIGEDS